MKSIIALNNKSQRKSLLMPTAFVALYGSGFVGAKLGLPYTEPLTFLAWRFLITAFLMTLTAFFFQASWPKKMSDIDHIMIAGLFMLVFFQSVYLSQLT